jgi:hypothetical protein
MADDPGEVPAAATLFGEEPPRRVGIAPKKLTARLKKTSCRARLRALMAMVNQGQWYLNHGTQPTPADGAAVEGLHPGAAELDALNPLTLKLVSRFLSDKEIGFAIQVDIIARLHEHPRFRHTT